MRLARERLPGKNECFGVAAAVGGARWPGHFVRMDIWDTALTRIDGSHTILGEWRGQVLLIVNVASQCGYTPQYAGLESLWRRFREHGFAILGFPCDQFANQEPGSDAEIAAYCSATWDVTFPMFAKTDVNGARTHPLYQRLKGAAPGVLGTESIKWNFTKFLVGRDGGVLARYAPTELPDELAPAIMRAIDVPPSNVMSDSAVHSR
jgi:glutathione peroxidase